MFVNINISLNVISVDVNNHTCQLFYLFLTHKFKLFVKTLLLTVQLSVIALS